MPTEERKCHLEKVLTRMQAAEMAFYVYSIEQVLLALNLESVNKCFY